MFLFKCFRNWFSQKKSPPELTDRGVSPAITRDLGVIITRIRMPSGGEIVIVEKVHDDDDNPV